MIYNLFEFPHAILRFSVGSLVLVLLSNSMIAQNVQIQLERRNTVVVDQSQREQYLASTGGMYSPIFLESDLNMDGESDLIIWDRGAHILRTLTWDAFNSRYMPAPEFEQYFPELNGWIQVYDYDQDGLDDLFVYSEDFPEQGILAYRGVIENDHIAFSLIQPDPGFSSPVLTFTNSESQKRHIFVSEIDIPTFQDVDDDGDMDILTFDQAGSYVRWYENQSELGSLDVFVLGDDCWGRFVESSISNDIKLSENGECPGIFSRAKQEPQHSGSSLFAGDLDYDNDLDLLIGDLSQSNVTFLQNGKNAGLDYMITEDLTFPSNNTPVNVSQFPAISTVDVNRDGLRDLLFTPNRFPEVDLESTWLYTLQDTIDAEYQLSQRDWLTERMNDFGSFSALAALSTDHGDELMIFGHNDQQAFYSFAEYDGENMNLTTDPISLGLEGRQTVFPSQAVDFSGYHQLVLGFNNGDMAIARVSDNQITGMTEIAGIDVGSDAAPTLLDYDRDGDLDLIVGELSGTLNLFMNNGNDQDWVFDSIPVTTFFGQVNVRVPGSFEGQSSPYAFMQDSVAFLICGSNSSTISVFKINFENPDAAFELVTDQLIESNSQGYRTTVNGYADGDQSTLLVGDIRGGISIYDLSVQMTVSTPELKIDGGDIEIFPNPTNSAEVLQIRTAHEISRMKIIDGVGRIIENYNEPLSIQSSLTLDGNIPPGVYYLRITLEVGTVVTKKITIVD